MVIIIIIVSREAGPTAPTAIPRLETAEYNYKL